MPYYSKYTRSKLDFVLNRIRHAIYQTVGVLSVTAWVTEEPVKFTNRTVGKKKKLGIGDRWGKLFDCAWFRFELDLPETVKDEKLVLLIDINGELCVYDDAGIPVRGLTNKSSTYDLRLGSPTKRVLQLTEEIHKSGKIDIWADAGNNDLFGEPKDGGSVKEAFLAVCREDVRALYYDFEVLYDLACVIPPETAQYECINLALLEAGNILKTFSTGEVERARKILGAELSKRGGSPSLYISAVGHAHLDLAWLWPIRETKRKGARTFSTVMDLMDRYPEYIFGASQAQLFQWIKEDYPLLYKKIKKRVKEGRFEVQGSTWVEADTNLPSGESLVRQLLYGKKFFLYEFALKTNYLWEPDAFGYSASLPQILKKSGVDYFITQKLSWNRINKFPHHSFKWRGIDGTEILTHLLPEETYNSPASPSSVYKAEKNYLDKGVSSQCLMVFGIGDGGGGPGAEHLERLARVKNIAGLCPVKQTKVTDFLSVWEKDKDRFQTWEGELYLERHQGTFTTQSKSKWYNRKMEIGLRDLEWKAVLLNILTGSEYPAQKLGEIWKEVLLYQFHDVLPGSSIERVYRESLERYGILLGETEELISTCELNIASSVDTAMFTKPYVVFSSLSWDRVEWVKIGNKWKRITVPAMGYTVQDGIYEGTVVPGPLGARGKKLENDFFVVSFNNEGGITGVFDKENAREVLLPAGIGNNILIYDDEGDAWDFPLGYRQKKQDIFCLVSQEFQIDGPEASVTHVYKYKSSEMKQRIVLRQGSRRIDFITWLDWHEIGKMIKTSFPLDINTDYASCEIQFGSIRRPTRSNTTWEMAKDEIPAHKWVDISTRSYGTALLNDSKYGYRVKDNTLELTLLRSVRYPGPLIDKEDLSKGNSGYTDLGEHIFTYSLYPHKGDYFEGGVVNAGYELNSPLDVKPCSPAKGTLPPSLSFITIKSPAVIIETVKKAENDNGIILRLYESSGEPCKTGLEFKFSVLKAEIVNLMEEPVQEIEVTNNSIELDFSPFEILTLKLAAVWRA